jgi:hypothetical protein
MLEVIPSTSKIVSTSQKKKGFYAKYNLACKEYNITPLNELKLKQHHEIHSLDIQVDRLRPHDWKTICTALSNDASLKFVAFRLRDNSKCSKEAHSSSLSCIYDANAINFFQFSMMSIHLKKLE